IGDVRARVPGNVEHLERHAQLLDGDSVSSADRMRKRRDRLAARPVYRNRVSFPKLRDTSDMVLMMMGGEDRDQLQLFGREIVEHRLGLTGVDYRRAARVAQGPDVVVPESAQGDDFQFAL